MKYIVTILASVIVVEFVGWSRISEFDQESAVIFAFIGVIVGVLGHLIWYAVKPTKDPVKKEASQSKTFNKIVRMIGAIMSISSLFLLGLIWLLHFFNASFATEFFTYVPLTLVPAVWIGFALMLLGRFLQSK